MENFSSFLGIDLGLGGSTESEESTGEDAEDSSKEKSEKKEKGSNFNEQIKKLMLEYKIQDQGSKEKNFWAVASSLGKEVEAKYGVPWMVVAMQACLESGFGKSGLSQKNFNCFGIKAQEGYKGDKSEWDTDEYFDGKTKSTIKSNFRSYSGIKESFMDYGRFLKENKRYSAAFAIKEPHAFLKEVIKAGYATDPNYLSKADSIAKKYGSSESSTG
jgi:flagellum-specific peptidoglycan hydrolase FlgJ